MGFGDAVASAGPYANNVHLTPDNHTDNLSLNFERPDALPDAQPTVSKHLRNKVGEKNSRSFPAFSRAINLHFHRVSQQKVNVIMTCSDFILSC